VFNWALKYGLNTVQNIQLMELEKRKKKDENTSFKVFYQETNAGQFVPRNLSVDLEPNVIDDVKKWTISRNISSRILVKW